MTGWTTGGVTRPYHQPLVGTERDIELAWAAEILAAAEPPILEVGNSTQRFLGGPTRDIVDRWDNSDEPIPVWRGDIVNFNLGIKYHTILSISTLEHVGNECADPNGVVAYPEEQDEDKAIVALEHLIDLLAPGGTLAFTIPTGYHPLLAEWVVAARWTGIWLMERINDEGDWVERPLAEFEPQEFPGRWGWSAGKVLFVRHVAPG